MPPIKVKIITQGLTVKAVAAQMGLSRVALSRKINGTIGWSLLDVQLLGKILSIPKQELLDYFPQLV